MLDTNDWVSRDGAIRFGHRRITGVRSPPS